jgi:uncharacterized protein (TIGR03118 family)
MAMITGVPAAQAGTAYYKAWREVSDVTLQQFPLGFAQYYDQKLDQPWGIEKDVNPCYVYSSLPCKTNAPAPRIYPELSSLDAVANAEQADGLRTLWVVSNLSGWVTNYYDTGAPLQVSGVNFAVKVPGKPAGIVLNPYCQPTRTLSATAVTYNSACNGTVPLNANVPFAITANGVKAAAVWLTSTREGKVYGWNPAVDPNNAYVVIDNSAGGASYTGLDISPDGGTLLLADFARNRIQSYDSGYQPVGFIGALGTQELLNDPTIPPGFAPSNVTFITYPLKGDASYALGTYPTNPSGVHLYVTYGKQAAPGANIPEVVGPAAPTTTYAGDFGHVSEFTFNSNGTYQSHQLNIPSDRLNAPWSVAVAPLQFGVDASTATSYDLYVGNFGDGYINVIDAASGTYMIRLGEAPNPIVPPTGAISGYPTVGTDPSVTATPIWEPGLRGMVFKEVSYIQSGYAPTPQLEWANRLFFVCNWNFMATDEAWEWSVFGFIRPG